MSSRKTQPPEAPDPLSLFQAPTRAWFEGAFSAPTPAQMRGWPSIAAGESTLLLAPTGSGKTLAAFLVCLDRLMCRAPASAGSTRTAGDSAPQKRDARASTPARCRVVYVSPIKALAVDIERNLRAPLVGIAHAAQALGVPVTVPEVMVRTGDTPSEARARFLKHGADIAITTPESLFLLLTSNAREGLRGVETVIVDEIHALVGSKRGAHLALSLERLATLTGRPLQRIGLSATQRPLDEVARFLGGCEPRETPALASEARSGPLVARAAATRRRAAARKSSREDALGAVECLAGSSPQTRDGEPALPPRPVTIVDAAGPKALTLRVEVPVEDMSRIGAIVDIPSGPSSSGPVRTSIWPSIHPRLLALIRAHRTTLIFVNGRRLAERLAGALNELAEEVLVQAHHGSVARAQRLEIEDNLKRGSIRGLVATSSLELGIDMGSIELVVLIECPPSVASGLQRVGRAGHQVGAESAGVLFPKFRGDLLACAAVTRAMREGAVEETRYPRNPLDVLAQQLVAMTAMEPWPVESLLATVRRAAPFADLGRAAFEGVLDMLAGRYPSADFAELRPRLTWDRTLGVVKAREGSKRLAITSGGTIPDRGLFGVYLAQGHDQGGSTPARAEAGRTRVGELDEQMVFESKVGDTFVLGASTWRIEEITHDRVLVTPAPGEPGRMPFWKGDQVGRPAELGRRIGRLSRELRALTEPAALARLRDEHDLDELAAQNLVRYLAEQAEAGAVPDDRTLVVERCRDELGDWRVCVLSPLGGRIHAPWALAVTARVEAERGLHVETLWNDEGFIVRFPDSDTPPSIGSVLLSPEEVQELVLGQLSGSAVFAARFREAAGRALLLPRRRPGSRTPLWQTRKRAFDLLTVASRYPSFPIVLEAMRECLRDVFDMAGLTEVLSAIARRSLRVVTLDSRTPSPFASALLFGYAANYLYDGDAPLAERRAQALSIDMGQLRELMGDVELRALLDVDVVAELEAELQRLRERARVHTVDGVHDLLLRLGDLADEELAARVAEGLARGLAQQLVAERRAIVVQVAGQPRFIAVEDAARYRDALGVPLPPGLPDGLLSPAADAWGDLVRRFARTHGPFTEGQLARRFGVPRELVQVRVAQLLREGRLVEGELRPGATGRDLCDPEVLKVLRRRSLAKVRREVEPVAPAVLGRMSLQWHGVAQPRRGADALLDAIEKLQGCPIPASVLERDVLSARVLDYRPDLLDALLAAGEVVWCGVEPIGDDDGRVALYLTDHAATLWQPPDPYAEDDALAARLHAWLHDHGASFFGELEAGLGGGFPRDVIDALWRLVWRGHVTNDSFHALRAYVRGGAARGGAVARRERRGRGANVLGVGAFRSRRLVSPLAEGRWSLVARRFGAEGSDTARRAARAQQLLSRHGLLTRSVAELEGLTGGFSAVYDVLRALDEAGRVRRGYFVSGVGGMQFATPPALELLRASREVGELPEATLLSAVDPANPYGALLRWPEVVEQSGGGNARSPARAAGAYVVLVDGGAAAYLARGGRQLTVFLPEDEPERSRYAQGVVYALAALAERVARAKGAFLIAEINGHAARSHPLAGPLAQAGFRVGHEGAAWPRDDWLKRSRGAQRNDAEHLQEDTLPPGYAADGTEPSGEEP